MGRMLRWAAMLCIAVTVTACNKGGVDAKRIEAAEAGEWLTYGRTYDEQRFSPLDQINKETVGRLGVAWWTGFDTDRGQEATPLVADGVLYTTTTWSKVFAFDAKTGKALWSYDPQVDGGKGFNACCDVVNRGVALWKDKVYVGALDGRLIALDAKTGKVVWSIQTTDPNQPYTITQAPRAVKGKILVGNGGAEYPVRGYLSAFDAETGKLVWRFHMTPNPTGAPDNAASDKVMKEKANATWYEGAWKDGGGGATPWDPITYDVKSDLIFVGTGNAGPWNGKIRTGGKGDNLFAASIVALRPDTGEYVWHYQPTPRDDWDFDATQHLMVADLPIGGKTQRVVMQANKNGFYYVLDAASGKLLAADAYVKVTWATGVDMATGRPIEAPGARYEGGATQQQTPGALGGHNWQPMAFSPKENLVYIPAQTLYMDYADPKEFKFIKGAWNLGLGPSILAPTSVQPTPFGQLIAWDPVAKKARWKVDFPEPWRSGVLATGGGLVFHAAGHKFMAFDAATGKALWEYDVGAGAIAAASTYAIDGEQYVALMVGFGGAGGMGGTEPRRKGRLLVFKLDGKTVPTPFPAVVTQAPLDLAAATPSTGDAVKGQALAEQFCNTCHNSGGYLPVLARSPVILEPVGFKAIVIDGARQPHGMAGFRRFFDAAAAEDIRAFLLAEAKKPPPKTQEMTHGR
ncbi:PQQ-dependent dehydrogenase, methanol/ethanol family [uncultured Phenylobacterium sp.]|uniref:PQQ-dependent dehydrogenase, methanol/ethanol family n=1 Tax=uncultured Phenylobacterium sp. TaxID=349273 RepID=UPI0025FCBCE0|nr:PQQ-dependent dehydrogenase, methanol/ethanol family [uncultured Phenylobacterium sp.]